MEISAVGAGVVVGGSRDLGRAVATEMVTQDALRRVGTINNGAAIQRRNLTVREIGGVHGWRLPIRAK